MQDFREFNDDDTLTLNWSIENFRMYSCTMESSIHSPKFPVKKLGRSYWELGLFSSKSDNHDYIACYLEAEMDSNIFGYRYRSCYETYRFTLSVRVGDTDFFENRETWCSLKTNTWICDKFIRRDLLRPVHLPNETLSIRCVIQPEPCVRDKNHIQDFKYLSQNLISLLDSEKYSDMVLITDDKTRFKVHKCIFSCRWPFLPFVLSRCGNVENEDVKSHGGYDKNYSHFGSEILVPNINSDTLETMIRYVYSGIIDERDVTQDLYTSSENLEFNTLKKNLTSYPKAYFGTTKLAPNFVMDSKPVDHKIVEWHLDDIRSWDTKPQSFTRILPVSELEYYFEIITVFSICTDAEGDRAIDIAFRIASSFEEAVPILMKCKISLSVQSGEALVFKEAKHLFQTFDLWHFPQPFKIRDIPYKRSLITMEIMSTSTSDHHQITTSDGASARGLPRLIHMETSKTQFLTSFKPMVDLLKLSTDMNFLVNASSYHPKDCILVCPNLREDEAHRAVLWARWPQLRPYLDEIEAEGCININIEENLLFYILSYMYSGHSKNIKYETAEKVLEGNESIPLPEHLLATCRTILENDCVDEDVVDADVVDADDYDEDDYDEDDYDEDDYDEDDYDEDGYDEDNYEEDGYDEDGYDLKFLRKYL